MVSKWLFTPGETALFRSKTRQSGGGGGAEGENYLDDGHKQRVLREVNIFPMGLALNGGRLSLSISSAAR